MFHFERYLKNILKNSKQTSLEYKDTGWSRDKEIVKGRSTTS